jgi:hypothetical protein
LEWRDLRSKWSGRLELDTDDADGIFRRIWPQFEDELSSKRGRICGGAKSRDFGVDVKFRIDAFLLANFGVFDTPLHQETLFVLGTSLKLSSTRDLIQSLFKLDYFRTSMDLIKDWTLVLLDRDCYYRDLDQRRCLKSAVDTCCLLHSVTFHKHFYHHVRRTHPVCLCVRVFAHCSSCESLRLATFGTLTT